MPVDIGRISGIMLKDNLERLGVDLAFETNLLYLDVTNNKIGIKTNSPGDDLLVLGDIRSTNLISDVNFTNSDITIAAGEISTALGSLNISAAVSVDAPEIQTDNISINNNVISTLLTDSNIELRPNGTGIVEVFNDVNITGNLHSTGNITLDGNITFGNQDTDSVTFNADMTSDIRPDSDGVYAVGSNSRLWNRLNTRFVNGAAITTSSLSTGAGINLALRQGNIWYVADNGSDTNEGDHPNGPFATIEHALSVAAAGDEVFVYPGTYAENFPLTVPVGVTVRGDSIRSVTVIPATGTENNNAFLLNGETTVSDLTVRDFYTGYAFSFASGFKVTTRSPYVQNITVITSESTPSAGDAGRGALVDGSVADSTTNEASMLFHSVTFITPGVDAITMTNGVRVEWLNSFTYYANRGLYATDGVLGLASLGTRFGAEIRSIGSANVYGTYGAVADGVSTLMYLINHNFGYIGTGTDSSNDRTLVIQANETVELNSGKIYYQSQDHEGNWRVGDNFWVNLDKGTTSFDTSGLAFDALSSLTVSTGAESTYIDPTVITTGNWRITGNTLETLSGDANILSATGTINLTQNVNIAKNLDITGDFQYEGNLTLGNQTTDTLTFSAPLDQNLVPDDDSNPYDLGSSDIVWQNTYVGEANIDSVNVNANTITTSATDTDLQIDANGTGIVSVPTSNVEITNDLTVTGLTDLQTTNIGTVGTPATIDQTGDRNQTGAYNQTGNFQTSGYLNVTLDATFPDVTITNNFVNGTATDTDVSLEPNGTGIVSATSAVYISNNLGVNTVTTTNGITVSGRTTADTFYTGDISINGNTVTTTQTDSDLVVSANGTGSVWLGTQQYQSNYLKHSDRIYFTPGTTSQLIVDSAGSLQVPVGSNTDRPYITYLTEFLTYKYDLTTTSISMASNLKYFRLNDTISSNVTQIYINTTDNNSVDQKAYLESKTVGNIIISQDSVVVAVFQIDSLVTHTTWEEYNVTFLSGSDLTFPDTPYDIYFAPIGVTTLSTVEEPKVQGDLRFNTEDLTFEGYDGVSSRGLGGVFSADRLTYVKATKTTNILNFVTGTVLSMDIDPTRLRANGLYVDDLQFNNSTVLATNNTDLTLLPTGTGLNRFEQVTIDGENLQNDNISTPLTFAATGNGYLKITGDNGFVIPHGDDAARPLVPQLGDIRYNTERGYIEAYDGTQYNSAAGVGESVTADFMKEETDIWALILG